MKWGAAALRPTSDDDLQRAGHTGPTQAQPRTASFDRITLSNQGRKRERAPSRRYLKPGFGCLRCSRRGWFVCFCRLVDALPEQCLRRRPSASSLVAAVFRTKRILRESCEATCLRRRRPGQARRRRGRLQITPDLCGSPCSLGDSGRGAEPALLGCDSVPAQIRDIGQVFKAAIGLWFRRCGSSIRTTCESACARPRGRTHQQYLRHHLQPGSTAGPRRLCTTPAARRPASAIAAVPGSS
jgi:hypothetical protein